MGNRIQTGNLGKSKNWTSYGTIQYRTFSQDCLQCTQISLPTDSYVETLKTFLSIFILKEL
ncbi:hypothetical protein E4413_09955 [Leptospira interrogans]|nr:hypothetical protein E4413_09955 [Leptospira interrogans]